MLEVQDIHTYYGHSYVLQGVTLRVEKGTAVAVLGRNGAGKTTLIRSIFGFTPPRQGTIRFGDVDITHMPSHRIVRMGMSLVPQGRRVFSSLTVKENLSIARRERGSHGWNPEQVFSVFPRLGERLKSRGDELSGGEQQMLAIGRALVSNPDLLVMDEPTEGLAPYLVQELEHLFQRLKADGLSILLVEQNLPFALTLADYCYIIGNGTIVYQSSSDELERDRDIKTRYLGV